MVFEFENIICYKRANGFYFFNSQAQVVPLIPKMKEKTKTITAEEIEENIFEEDVHNAVTKGVALENTLRGQTIPLPQILYIFYAYYLTR